MDTQRFVVVGAGGIGTWLCHGLARMLEFKAPGSVLVIVDGDNFEDKNRERQVFNGAGNKAVVLASELQASFTETIIVPLPMWVVKELPKEDKEELELDGTPAAGKITASDLIEENDVVFAVVDNFKARKDLFDAAMSLDNVDVFTGGNDESLFGSVYHYQRRDGEEVTEHPAVRHDEYVNPPDRNPGELSCQERAELEGGTQVLATNMTVAGYLLGRTQKVIVDGQEDHEAEIYFDLGAGLSSSYDRSADHTKILQGV